MLFYIKNLNEFGESNRFYNALTLGHTGVYDNEMAENLAKSGSTVIVQGPKSFIPDSEIVAPVTKNWCRRRWKSSSDNGKTCLKTEENMHRLDITSF